jgi:hypothetical protein
VHDLDDPALARLTREARYETLIGLAAGNLRAGRPVVLVAPFSTERADPSAWATTTRLLEAEPTLVWLHLPPDELVRRWRPNPPWSGCTCHRTSSSGA